MNTCSVRRVAGPRWGARAGAAVLAILALALLGLSHATAAINAAAASPRPVVRTDEVCFSVHNHGDPVASSTYGVRYYTETPAPRSRVIILVHGNSVTHALWDLRPDFSVARRLADAGYLVIAYERLGYPKSPYQRARGSGFTLTLSSQREMLHEVVGELKAGSYTHARDGSCSGGELRPVGLASQSIILIGHSGGGAAVSGYPGIYHDVAAVVQMGWSNQGLSPEGTAYLAGIYSRSGGADYVNAFPTADGCRAALLYEPAVAPSLMPQFCDRSFVPAPAGEIYGVARTMAENLVSIGKVGAGLPVLLAWEDRDFFFTSDEMVAEHHYWLDHCGCDVQSWTQPETGHAFIAHLSMPTFTSEVVSWLISKSLASK